ncbi:MAG: 1,4-alpha-glucan branching protein GlgB [Gammaproteobacteria bacterium]|nr:1,4-alpha-glucan branching protein GlgB [Gammaproteobacteria bacterium]
MSVKQYQTLLEAREHNPFAFLGPHQQGNETCVSVFLPRAERVFIDDLDQELTRIQGTDVFEWCGDLKQTSHYRLRWLDAEGRETVRYDPFCFPAQIPEFDIHLFGEGRHWHIYRLLGANPWSVDKVVGVLFATWAPNAERVSVIGNFNHWDGRCHPMRSRGGSGLWELFVPDIHAGELYKFEIRSRDSGQVLQKIDPYGKQFELRPKSAGVIARESEFLWHDQDWIATRAHSQWQEKPMSIYEVHLGSWRRDASHHFLNYRQLAHELVDYVTTAGFTHIELLPITEHPLDASWGYQVLGFFAPTSRFGTPDDFRYFVDYCHQHDIGVFLDWVPAHFPMDAHGLGRFDGTALYEHEDPRRGEHRDWGTYIFNYGRNEVKNFLLSSAMYWLEEFHIDGLRVDAVASMLYLDYSREAGDWIPNEYGGRENLDAIAFLRQLNSVTHSEFPGTLVMAEESTAWPQVSRPVYLGGLGFSMKWNMGWMHDTLEYMKMDPIHRKFHHEKLTFGQLYSFTENFVLPFSHDEVVHGKGSLRYRMPGDEWQQFANVRLLFCYLFTYPGKKLLFMGNEYGQGPEWDFDGQLDWYVLQYPLHQGLLRVVQDLNHVYRSTPALFRREFSSDGFCWVDCHDSSQSVLSYRRMDGDQEVIVVLNFTPIPRHDYRIGVPHCCRYRELLNTDAEIYGGSNIGNAGVIDAENVPWMNLPYSIAMNLPPLAGIVLQLSP